MQVTHNKVTTTTVEHTDAFGTTGIYVTSWANGEGIDVFMQTGYNQSSFSLHESAIEALIEALKSHEIC